MLGSLGVAPYELEFYEDENGDQPVHRWLTTELSPRKRRVLGTAMRHILQRLGIQVCGTEYGKQLGGGLFEFRLRGRDLTAISPASGEPAPGEAKMLLRVFCHAHGDRLVLLLGGYDKGQHPSPRRQSAEIAIARKRLRAWNARRSG